MHYLHRIESIRREDTVIVSFPVCEVPFETTRRVVLQSNCIAVVS